MDIIVSVCRVLANRQRLSLLRTIYAQPDATVQVLATAIALPIESASKHLKLLANFRLVEARPQGRYVHYNPGHPRPGGHPFLRDLLAGLPTLLKSHCTLAQVCNSGAPAAEADEALLKTFTTYTHLRRLLLLRYLLNHGSAAAVELAAEIHMSPTAVHRHMRKLQRRAVVAITAGTPLRWVLIRPERTDSRRQLLDIILRSLAAATHRKGK